MDNYNGIHHTPIGNCPYCGSPFMQISFFIICSNNKCSSHIDEEEIEINQNLTDCPDCKLSWRDCDCWKEKRNCDCKD